MATLIVIPTKIELNPFLERLKSLSVGEPFIIDKREISYFPRLELYVAPGGLGKAQFAVQTQFYLDHIDGLERVFCLGAAGSLEVNVKLFDIVIGVKTIEHDIKTSRKQLIPCFEADRELIETMRRCGSDSGNFTLHFGPIASGDEEVSCEESKERVAGRTKALAVAWEGAGGARACQFSHVPFVEIRGISDSADGETHRDFKQNLKVLMVSLADYISFVLAAL
ncbi:MAG: 5'-methylthioadenosine/S-adenosylhomocysteine nucleosidase [Spirochaetales bacterium]|nr:5'-methylthioadenosine/S-adenosylhomocysteine nucleosidase [Spirochaetales bacterium]